MATAKQILLFDDNYESLLPLKEFLEGVYHYQVDLTADITVISKLQTITYDLVIIDRMIAPNGLDGKQQGVKNLQFEGVHWEQTGTEFLLRLRKGEFNDGALGGTPSSVPVIVLSAVTDTSVAHEQRKARKYTRYMEKPFDLEELVDVLNELLTDVTQKNPTPALP